MIFQKNLQVLIKQDGRLIPQALKEFVCNVGHMPENAALALSGRLEDQNYINRKNEK